MPLPGTKVIRFKGRTDTLIQQPDGSYKDSNGTIYPQALFDDGYCGIWNVETGSWDPFYKGACKPHDISFIRLKNGYKNPEDSNLKVAGRFAGSVLSEMASGAYAVLTGPFYLFFGMLGGLLRWEYLERKQGEKQ